MLIAVRIRVGNRLATTCTAWLHVGWVVVFFSFLVVVVGLATCMHARSASDNRNACRPSILCIINHACAVRTCMHAHASDNRNACHSSILWHVHACAVRKQKRLSLMIWSTCMYAHASDNRNACREFIDIMHAWARARAYMRTRPITETLVETLVVLVVYRYCACTVMHACMCLRTCPIPVTHIAYR